MTLDFSGIDLSSLLDPMSRIMVQRLMDISISPGDHTNEDIPAVWKVNI